MLKIAACMVGTAGICGLAVAYAAYFSPPLRLPQGNCQDPWSMYFILWRSNPKAAPEMTMEGVRQIRALCKTFGPNAVHRINCKTDFLDNLKCSIVQ